MQAIIETLEADWKAHMGRLESKFRIERESSQRIAEATECLKVIERSIETYENALVADQTKPEGAINGKNEDTRRSQRAAFLAEQRTTGKLVEMYNDANDAKSLITKSQQMHAEVTDDIEICRLQLAHINAVLRALGGQL